MRQIVPVILAGVALALTGCASNRSAPDGFSFEEYHRRLAATASVEVPLPETTPYDADVEARRAYLDYYRDGYRSGLTGIEITCCLEECPQRRARVAGWYAGQSAGRAARGKDPW